MYSEKNCIITINGNDCTIQGKCLLTDKLQTVSAKTEDYERWVKGEGDIKNLMPYLTQSEMNFIAHGVTDEGWEKVNSPKISIPKAQ
jgi:hypothetical protein